MTVPSTGRGPRRPGAWTGLALADLDPDRERPYWIVIAQVPGIGPVTVARLVARAGSLRAAWEAGLVEQAVTGLPADVRRAAVDQVRRARAQGIHGLAAELTARGRSRGIRPLTALDRSYPPRLAHLDPRPAVLWAAGDSSSWHETAVAVVGTRRPSGYGRAAAEEIGDELARAGVTVVSGLAVGIDAVAHAAAVSAGGRSVAVLPSPIDRIYPSVHQELARRLVRSGGALLSELPPGLRPGRPDFARRNTIIAGLSEAVVVVEAPDRSGALLTADAAIGYGRELFAVPGPMDAATSRGTNRLIADHVATLVTSPAALLHLIGLQRGQFPVSVRSLSEAEGLVLAAVLKRSGSIEELVPRVKLATSLLAATLTMLEARGLVTAYSGATFHATLEARRSGWGTLPAPPVPIEVGA
ncbi:MAG TPA: DNA-processing protein DprA [Candidatus Limnocylindria bacterium]|nr:DNA-processing protein DprA [Candidatus Limnocylindria bacterium]